MNVYLREIDDVCRKAQQYLDFDPEKLRSISIEDWIDHQKMYHFSIEVYDLAMKQLIEIFPNLTSSEITEGYMQGCRLLQRALSGCMARAYKPEYRPTMIMAINIPHLHTANIFLQSLADNIGSEVSGLVLMALYAREMRQTALSIVGQLSLIEALPELEHLTSDSDPAIAHLAETILVKLSSNLR